MNSQTLRALLLLNQGRFEEAEQEVGQALAADPNCPHGLRIMALCLTRRGEFDGGTLHAQRAVAEAPDSALMHYTLGVVWFRRSYYQHAADSAEEAIRLDPQDADYRVLLGQIRFNQGRYQAALEAADAALEIDPEETDAINLRAQALQQLGRKDVAVDGLHDALQLNPENPRTHATLGWNYLEQGNLPKAQEHFREALRLNPELEWARRGLIETIKSRNVIYRMILNWFLWMQKKAAGHQWAILVGAFVAYLICLQLVESKPELGIVLWPILGLYIAFCVATWLAMPLSNLALRLHPFGRLVLTRRERFDATMVGLGVLTTLTSLGISLYYDSILTFLIFMGALRTTVAVSMVALLQVTKARRIMGLYALAVGVMSLIVIAGIPLVTWPESSATPLVRLWAAVTGLCVTLLRWSILGAVILANILAAKNWKDTPD